MGLLWPLYLLGLFAILVPILLHFISRMRPDRQPLPTLFLLREALAKQSAFSKLQGLLLLLVRIAIIFLLAFLFATPFFYSNDLSLKKARRVLVVIDNSSTMLEKKDGTTLLRIAKQRASHMVTQLANKKLYYMPLFFLPDKKRTVYSDSRSEVLNAIRTTQAVAGSCEATEFFQYLRSRYNKKTLPDTIIFFSNTRLAFWKRKINFPAKLVVVPIVGSRVKKNIYIKQVVLPAVPYFVGTKIEVQLVIAKNFEEKINTEIRVTTPRGTIYKKKVLLNNFITKHSIKIALPKKGDNFFKAELSDTLFKWDNSYYFVVNVQKRLRVYLGKTGYNYYLRSALQALYQRKIFISDNSVMQYDAMFMPIDGSTIGMIKKMSQKSSLICLYPSYKSSVSSLISHFRSIGIEASSGGVKKSDSIFRVNCFPGTSSTFTMSLKVGRKGLFLLRFNDAIDSIVMRADQHVLAFTTQLDRKRYTYFSFMFTPAMTDLVQRKEFPILLKTLFAHYLYPAHYPNLNNWGSNETFRPLYTVKSALGRGIYKKRGVSIAFNPGVDESNFNKFWKSKKVAKKYTGELLFRTTIKDVLLSGRTMISVFLLLLIVILKIVEIFLAKLEIR